MRRMSTDRTRPSTIASWVGLTRRLGQSVPHAGQCWRPYSGSSRRQFGGESAPLGLRRQSGEKNQAIGRSRGGRTTKIHALTGIQCRSTAFRIAGGNIADWSAGARLLENLPNCHSPHGDKGYESNAIRRQVEANGTMPNIPPKATRRWNTASSRLSIVIATQSSTCSAASRTSVASPPNTTDTRQNSSPPYVLPLPSATGCVS